MLLLANIMNNELFIISYVYPFWLRSPITLRTYSENRTAKPDIFGFLIRKLNWKYHNITIISDTTNSNILPKPYVKWLGKNGILVVGWRIFPTIILNLIFSFFSAKHRKNPQKKPQNM